MKLRIESDRFELVEIPLDKPIELGRQRLDEPEPLSFSDEGDRFRCVFAEHTENTVSRRQLLIEYLDNQLKVTNLNPKRRFELHSQLEIEPGGAEWFDASRGFGFHGLEVHAASQVSMQSLPNQTIAPGDLSMNPAILQTIQQLNRGELAEGTQAMQGRLVEWLTRAMVVFQEAATSPKFLEGAARAVQEIVNLSTAGVLIKEGGKWIQRATHCPGDPDEVWQPSQTIIERVEKEQRTFFNLSEQDSHAQSLIGVEAIVASPILSGDHEVIGILYGDRRREAGDAVTELEAVLVEVLATGVAAGLARVEQEEQAIRARADFERSFGEELTRHLEKNPEMLAGRVADISIMFCDVTGFSAASEELGPEKTMSWIGEVMGVLHQCVIDHQGVVIDYVGDELIAMWGAPVDQSDHAELAAAATHTIQQRLEAANREHQFVRPAKVRIGINSGPAHVGDTGTRFRLKYGAMGDTVNLASRLQGAAKFFGSEVLISAETRSKLSSKYSCRRLGRVKVVNIARPIEIFELLPGKLDMQLSGQYEQALQCIESGEIKSAADVLDHLVEQFPADEPTQVLRRRLKTIQTENPQGADLEETSKIWELPSK